ncbi:MAG: hypothetical protein V7713_13550, partial [Marinobacter sp.]
MRFTGTVLAVLVANILTIAVLTGAYVYLRSDHGQELLYELGLHTVYFSLAASAHDPEIGGNPSVWRQLSCPVRDNYDGRLGGLTFYS